MLRNSYISLVLSFIFFENNNGEHNELHFICMFVATMLLEVLVHWKILLSSKSIKFVFLC